MLDSIRHRGPDDAGTYIGTGLAMGMRRLSIIDIAGGHQPMVSSDAQTILLFNGEIYNFPKLREELSANEHVFRTRSDTEVILHGYREWGEDVVKRLNGMFAIAIYDRRDNTIFLARDHFGIKPLYYYARDGFFAFCSEPISLLKLPGVSRRLDRKALCTFLAYKYVPAPRTFVEGLRKLEPGACMRVDAEGKVVSHRMYWRLDSRLLEIGAAEAEEHLRALLIGSVRRQLVSDVPLGLFLSGGIDSGLLLWAAREALGHAFVDAYTVGFDNASFDESTMAAETARYLGGRHHIEHQPLPDASEIDAMVELFGEPFANLSVPANFLLSRVTARHVKVALNGSGADELFGGYDRYYAVRPPAALAAARALSPIFLRLAMRLPVGGGSHSLVVRARSFLATAGASPAEAHAAAVRLFTSEEVKVLAPDLDSGPDLVATRFASAPGFDDLQRATWTDMVTMMAEDYLTLIDRTSMAASLEVRVPFLDVDLAEFAFSLPSALKINGFEKKVILRRLGRKHLPKHIVRAPKHGFESPVAQWFRGNLGDTLRELVYDGPASVILDGRFVERLLAEHRTWQVDASKQLLGIYTLSRWLSVYRISA